MARQYFDVEISVSAASTDMALAEYKLHHEIDYLEKRLIDSGLNANSIKPISELSVDKYEHLREGLAQEGGEVNAPEKKEKERLDQDPFVSVIVSQSINIFFEDEIANDVFDILLKNKHVFLSRVSSN